MRIRKGDTVLVISGKDRGKTGKVLRVFPAQARVLVEGVHIRKKHLRPKRAGEKGQVMQHPSPTPVSNVKLLCTKCGKPTRIGYRREAEKKYRICKKCNQEI